MSNIWGTRYRVLCEQLEEMVEKLSDEQPIRPELLEEMVVRLLAPVVVLVRQHAVNHRGQCQLCGWTRWKWRFWRRRRRCTVFQALDHALSQGLDVAWWQLCVNLGNKVSLAEVRQWLSKQQRIP